MINRFFEIICDDCNEKTIQSIWGMPKDWAILRPLFKIKLKHLCPRCKNNYSEKEFLNSAGK